jgi:acid phosphatase (class A)
MAELLSMVFYKGTIMKMRTVLFALLLSTLSSSSQELQRKLEVLTSAEADPSRLLPPPPTDGSDNQQKELAEVRRLVKTRTPERYKQAVWDSEHEDPTAFAATIGPGFDLNKLPATAKLLAVVMNDQSVMASKAKEYFRRKFPVAVDPSATSSYHEWSCDTDVKKPVDRPLRSYPSGHATMGYSVGIVLAALMPDKAQAILARAADYAYSREICGDHYHADVEASHALGTAAGIMLLNNASLKPQVAAARAELAAAHLTGR